MRYLTGSCSGTARRRSPGIRASSSSAATRSSCWPTRGTRSRPRREAVGARVEPTTYDLAARWPELVASLGARRVAVEAGSSRTRSGGGSRPPHRTLSWSRPRAGSRRSARPRSPPRSSAIAAACAVADRALAALLPEIRPGVTERRARAAARMADANRRRRGAGVRRGVPGRTRGGAAARFAGRAAGARRVGAAVRLRRAGCRLPQRHDADAVRGGADGARSGGLRGRRAIAGGGTRRLEVAVAEASREGAPLPTAGPSMRSRAAAIEADGRWPAYGHGLGHGIGLATHEQPSLSRSAPETPLPSPTVFSVEPGIYLEGEMGVRIEDLVRDRHARPDVSSA